uniref:UDP-N-acetylmuramoyl-L-alanyl-D-glutamate--2, 6-diaminopimelate ligase n=1 Tax=Pararhizobium sp. IMCC3301 TaxID=3067904 RepID=UPI002741B263|nr:UDP-N-acetylmuramoyl-L-alanyl-D-glutamate--2,6-diaminopimelate ligase [Pararhizobium sp. IMCC3301]
MMRLGDLLKLDAPDRVALISAELTDDMKTQRITGICADSRKVQRGNLFVAISGVQTDGAAFIDSAVEAGAVAVLIDEKLDLDPSVLSVPLIRSNNPRRALALLAARFYPRQPKIIVAVTGTAGKTSVANFTAQMFKSAGLRSASIGTLGVIVDGQVNYGGLTTPDPVFLHKTLDRLAREGVNHVALEASSHGLDQHRLDGVQLTAGAFTNLGRDHMDYHQTEADYFAAKARLITDLLPTGAPFVVNIDAPWGDKAAELADSADLRILRIGEDIRLTGLVVRDGKTGPQQDLTLSFFGEEKNVTLPLPGSFQAENALMAAGLAISCKIDPVAVLKALAKLKGVSGRLELVDMQGVPGQIFVDYAHKPDALRSTLQALRPYPKRLLIVIVGAGGDRDKGKRPLMGQIAHENADLVIVTDDNPRNENPELIRSEILATAPRAIEIADRARAIATAVSILTEDDVLVVAGKGHEEGQIIGKEVLPFSDHEEIAKALAARKSSGEYKKHDKVAPQGPPLWTFAELEAAMGGRLFGSQPKAVHGVSIDSRTSQPGDLFFAIRGDKFDGHDFVTKSFRQGAVLAIVSEDKLPALGRTAGPFLVVADVLEALQKLGKAARARSAARIVAVTGSVGKTSTKELLATGLSAIGRVHASVKSFNNHWGVPLSLARMPLDAEYGLFEIGMNHPGEIDPLVRMVRPHVAIITTIAPVHLEFFDNLEQIAAAKAEIFSGLEPGGTAILNSDNGFFEFLKAEAAKAGADRVISFGSGSDAEARLVEFALSETGSIVAATICGDDLAFTMPTSGRYLAENAMAVLAAAEAMGADTVDVAQGLSNFELMGGRGARETLFLQGGSYTLIDDSYNANPASMSASIGMLGELSTRGRKIVVLGDMLELGGESAHLHVNLNSAIEQAQIDRVLLCGPQMKHLWDALADSRKCVHTETSKDLMAPLLAEISPGDVVMVKGSLGMAMSGLVDTLKRIHSAMPDQPAETVRGSVAEADTHEGA